MGIFNFWRKEMKGFVEKCKEYEETLQNMREFLKYHNSDLNTF